MKILMSSIVQKKLKKTNLGSNVKKRVQETIQFLKNLCDDNYQDLLNYMIEQNSKKLKGTKGNHIFKLRIDKANRLAFTYGRFMPNIRPEDENSLVILDCLKHDQQDNFSFPNIRNYLTSAELLQKEDLLSDIETTTTEELEQMEIADLNDSEMWDYYFEENTMNVLDDEKLFEEDLNNLDVYLSDQQHQYIQEYQKNPHPTLVLGGAGTGKTIMVLNMLYAFKDKNIEKKCLYITQSRALLENAKKRYLQMPELLIDKEIPEVHFENIIEYCRQELNLDMENFVTYETFVTEFIQKNEKIISKINKTQIHLFDLWAEIRGTIKGGLEEQWNRTDWFDQQNLPFENICKELEKYGVIHRQKNDLKKFKLSKKAMENPTSFHLSENAQNALNYLYNISLQVNPSLSMMDKDIYLNLKEENTTLEEEKRKLAYEVCLEYQKWLGTNKFDDNDMIRKMLEKKTLAQYDFIVVDEIQDYTELQIYMLRKMVKSPSNMILAGDTHQIINPTMFREERIKKLFQNETLRIQYLEKNYRCQEKIVNYANALSCLREKYVAKMGGYCKEYSKRNGEEPFVLKYSKDTMKKLLEELKNFPNVAVLVPDETVKEEVIHFIGKTEYATYPPFIFTVAEIKGMEYNYVVCYELVGHFQKIWNEIFLKKAKKQTKYRYYFNLMYVGISRAQNHLCIINKHDSKPFETQLEKELHHSLNYIEQFNPKILQLNTLTNSEEAWMEYAYEAMKNGQYENAKIYFQKANAPIENFWECDMRLEMDNYFYQTALKYAILLQDKENAKICYRAIHKNSPIAKLAEIWLFHPHISKKTGFKKNSITSWIKQEFAEFEVEIQEQLQLRYLTFMYQQINEQLNNIRGN